ncbi:hypothetical protein AHMF7616_01381 [Adhaeribacter pallidiroseus]|uniref:Uncharacterized protein n=1 Tax=Adhaeribacter pallidiroseus TaxID=2072847 RepID=A0A369QHN0_9BACT|nr:hypothetical protein AHMF7616_01381 [Adhaeribacter pallidiroseus]
MIELRVARGWAVFIYLTAPLLIFLFGWLLFMPFLPNAKGNSNNLIWFLTPVSLGMIGLMVIGLLDTIFGKVVIEADRIYSKSILSNRELLFNEISTQSKLSIGKRDKSSCLKSRVKEVPKPVMMRSRACFKWVKER